MRAAGRGRIEVFPRAADLALAAAEQWVALATEAMAARGRFTVALAGGETPRATYAQLASKPFSANVDWSRVHIFWGDERCVSPDHPSSNYRMAQEALLGRVAIPGENVHRIRGELDPEGAAAIYEAELRTFFGRQWPQFDLVLLGMGSDGHTASLFPGSAALGEDKRVAVVVTAHYEDLPAWRVTLTAQAINRARQVLLLVSGRAKAATLRAVLSGPPGRYPVQEIRPAAGPLTWFVDAAAASQLESSRP
ncbi:MAG: 6-phosphogluconolactonase [Chloroflexi bacterium]|nr:6-phosphogluconolactonase [Chloroflexota bacterium]